MAKGSILKREGKTGTSWLLKYDAGRNAETGARKQRYKTVRGTKKDAEKELRRLLGRVDDGTHVDPSKTTVADWAETWLLDHAAPNVSQRTLEGYRLLLRVHVVPTLGDIPIQKLTAPQIQALYTRLRASGRRPVSRKADASSDAEKSGLSARSVLHVHRVLFQCLKTAKKQQVIFRNPAEDVTAHKRRNGTVEGGPDNEVEQMQALEKAQLPALFRAFKGNPLYPLVALATGTGLRRGELLALSWVDVDLDKRTVRVTKAIEDSRDFGLRIKSSPKNDSSRRTIGIDEGLCDVLRTHRREQKELALKLGTPYPSDCLVFPCVITRAKGRQPLAPRAKDVDFSRPWNPNAITKGFVCVARAAGFEGLRLHDLRHTHASQLLDAGLPVHAVAQRLGHSTPVVTMTIYAHVLKRAEDRAAEVSGDLLRDALGE
ncbi:MAG: site-specific integrase [Zoogloeaceae bacterium]|nr:site-specific integrase [Zoogloeaceae bacterium]